MACMGPPPRGAGWVMLTDPEMLSLIRKFVWHII